MSTETRARRTPGPDHPITVSPTGHRVVARVGETVVAESTGALTLQESTYPPAYYVPLADVDAALLRRSATTTWCPYKGEASYYSLVVDGTELTDAVWSYQQASPAVAGIAGFVAFYTDRVDVTVAD
ncbi:MAG: DUF427 domain-containing protein [Janthinobacterium lividum]